MKRTYEVNGTLLKQARKELGLTQKAMEEPTGRSEGTIIAAENERKRFLLETIEDLANGYGVDPAELAPGAYPDRPKFLGFHLGPPTKDKALIDRFSKAASLDMNESPRHAAELYREIERSFESDTDPDLIAFTRVRLATSLDNAGEHHEALEVLGELLDQVDDPNCGIDLSIDSVHSILYHGGLAQLHLAQYGDALKRMGNLAGREGKFKASAIHQIGNILLHGHRYKTAGDPVLELEDVSDLIGEAREAFQRSARSWQNQGNWRCGYSFRRLAEVAIEEDDREEALEKYLDALEWFSESGCRKYVREVREAIWGLMFPGSGGG